MFPIAVYLNSLQILYTEMSLTIPIEGGSGESSRGEGVILEIWRLQLDVRIRVIFSLLFVLLVLFAVGKV